MDRNELIAWAAASGTWLLVLLLLVLLASRERRRGGSLLGWILPRVGAGLALWVAVLGATRWVERKVSAEAGSRAVHSTRTHSGSRAR